MSNKNVVVFGTLDTKDPEYRYLIECIRHYGFGVTLIDTSCYENITTLTPDYTCFDVAEAGGSTFEEVRKRDRMGALSVMIPGVTKIIKGLVDEGKVDAVVALGGGNGIVLGGKTMQELPPFLPKFLITCASTGNVSEYIGMSDIFMVNCVGDICLNSFIGRVIANTVQSIAGILSLDPPPYVKTKSSMLATTMMGLSQKCVVPVKDALEQGDFEVFVYHTNGVGGRTMEKMIAEGAYDGVLDITTNEPMNDLLGGFNTSGPTRMEAAFRKGIPTVIVPGCVDFINFPGKAHVPEKYRDRRFIHHTIQATLMRTLPEEIYECATRIGEKLKLGNGPVVFLVPAKGFSGNDKEGGAARAVTYSGEDAGPWYMKEGPQAYYDALSKAIPRDNVEIKMLDYHVNDPEFAEEVVAAFKRIYR